MQEQGEVKRPEQGPEGGATMYCPECGEAMGPWGMYHHHHMGPWAKKGMGPWGMRPMMGPWGMGMACRGVLPALLGFAIGYMVASTRMAAWHAFSEGKEGKWKH